MRDHGWCHVFNLGVGQRQILPDEQTVKLNMANLMIVVALAFALIAGLTWFTFLRPVPVQTAMGTIRSKSFKPAGEYWQQPVGNRDGFWTATRIPIAECYIFGIQVDGRAGEARVSLNTGAAQAFNVGQRVWIEYVERGFPPIWKRDYVSEMKRAD
jgi:hypothetical protein